MKVLIVARKGEDLSPFVCEQMSALRNRGIEIDSYGIEGKGLWVYLSNYKRFKRKIRAFQPDLIHAHYGFSGLFANFQRKVPVITTYHGSDVHSGGWILKLSQLAMKLSGYNIFVSSKLLELSGYRKNNMSVIPCGIDLDAIKEMPRDKAGQIMGMQESFVLFSGSFANKIKNYALAKEAMKKVPGVKCVELQGYSRQEVNFMMNAAGCLLMTSDQEGSPQVIKEAMACGTPIVTVDVGDVKEVLGDVEGCYVAERNPNEIAAKIQKALSYKGKTSGRQRIIDLGLDNALVAEKLKVVYQEVLQNSKKGH